MTEDQAAKRRKIVLLMREALARTDPDGQKVYELWAKTLAELDKEADKP
jgi:hypothetical protein